MLDVFFSAMLLAAPPAPKLPDRLVRCDLARATNLNPSRDQRPDEIVFKEQATLAVYLPDVADPQGVVPETDAPVDPRYAIVSDPAGLFGTIKGGLNRVGDLWPKRVELSGMIDAKRFVFLVLDPIDPVAGTTRAFVSRAADAASVELGWAYLGPCTIETGKPARDAAAAAAGKSPS